MANLSYYDGSDWITLSNLAVSMVGGGASIKKLRTETVVAQNTFAAGDTAHIISATGTVTPEINAVSTLPTGLGNGVAFNHDGTRCAIAHYASPYITIYDTTTSPWTKIANPSTLPTGTGYGVAFNHDGTRCAIAHSSSPYITIYDTTTSPWTKIADPSTLSTSTGNGVAFNHDGTRCAITRSSSPYITIYDTTTSPWTKIADPSMLPTGTGNGVAFNHDGTRCAIAYNSSPYVIIYDFIYNTPLAFNANNTVTSRECSYGYATAAIASGSTGTIDVIFD